MSFTKIDLPEQKQIPLHGAICFCEWQGKILMLKRSLHCHQGGLWTAAPGGKLESGETPVEAVIRETFEETGICLEAERLDFQGSFLCRFSEIEYVLHIFKTKLVYLPELAIDLKEHTEMRWATPLEALEMPLMRGGLECLAMVYTEIT